MALTAAHGFVVVNKPLGLTSHQVVGQARRWFGTRQVGHAGTLDPLASGVLVLLVGSYTRLSDYVLAKPKSYQARVCFGQTTATYDAEGLAADIPTQPVAHTITDITNALARFVGDIEQVPPAFSAIKQAGQPVYKLARRGEAVALPARAVHIARLAVLHWDNPLLTLQVECSAGTYIRSLAHDLGQQLGCGAFLAGLVRTASGCFRLADSHTPEACQQAAQAGQAQHLLRSAAGVFPEWQQYQLTDSQVIDIGFGRALHNTGLAAGQCLLWHGETLCALGVVDAQGKLQPQKVF